MLECIWEWFLAVDTTVFAFSRQQYVCIYVWIVFLSFLCLADTHGCIIATIRLFINDVEVSGLDPPVQQVMQMVQVKTLVINWYILYILSARIHTA